MGVQWTGHSHRQVHLQQKARWLRRAAGPAAGLGGSGRGGECERQHGRHVDHHPLLEAPGHGGLQRQAHPQWQAHADGVELW